MFQTILPHYRHVKPIVARYQDLYSKQFPKIKNWECFGKLILVELIKHFPELLENPVALRLTYQLEMARMLGLLANSKILIA